MRVGYFLSSEEVTPAQLLAQARAAEAAGFAGLWISDHYHPWNDEQGQSPFVWSMIGALSQVTSLPISTAVTCPTTADPPRDRGAGRRDLLGAARRTVRARRGQRGGAQRAHPGRPVAVRRRA